MGGRFPQPIKVIDHQGTESSFELFRDIDVNNRSRHNRSVFGSVNFECTYLIRLIINHHMTVV